MQQQLRIESSGIIKGGHCDLTVNPNGLVQYNAEIQIKVGFMTKTKKFSGEKWVAPEAVQSTTYNEPKQVDFPGVRVNVLNADESTASANLDFESGMTGECLISKVAEEIAIINAQVNFNYGGMSFTLKVHN